MINQSTLRVRTRPRGNGWTFELFTDDDPLTFIEGDLRTFATQQEAERAGYEAREALIRRMGRPA
jgi:hypothetical protein